MHAVPQAALSALYNSLVRIQADSWQPRLAPRLTPHAHAYDRARFAARHSAISSCHSTPVKAHRTARVRGVCIASWTKAHSLRQALWVLRAACLSANSTRTGFRRAA